MRSHINAEFRASFRLLPSDVQHQARAAYRLFTQDPRPPGLHFKRVHTQLPIYSARVGIHYRALGIVRDQDIIWFWIGSHADYDRIVANL